MAHRSGGWPDLVWSMVVQGERKEGRGERREKRGRKEKKEKNERKRKEKGRERRKEREKRKFSGLFRFYTSLDFLEQNFVFAYFCSCLQFLTNTTLK